MADHALSETVHRLILPQPPPGGFFFGASMKTSQRGINDLILSEGLRTTAYKDSVGVWTIGVGHTAAAGPPAPKAGMVITRQGAIDLLTTDLVKYEATVNRVLPGIPQHVFDGAVSFHFNTGAIARATWPKLYKAGKLKEAKSSFLTWNKPPEIMKRRKRESALIFDGVYATPAVTQGASQTAPAPALSPPPPDIPATDPEPVFYPNPAPSGGVAVPTGVILAGGGLTTVVAAINDWRVWLGFAACMGIAALIAYLVYRDRG